MQKKILASSIALLAVAAFSASANAANQNWAGPYVGASVGAASLTGNANNYYGEIDSTTTNAVVGLNAGYNWQVGSAVIGVEADINGGDLETINPDSYGGYYRQEAKWNWFSTIRGRAGMTVGNTMLYVTGGVAIVDTDYKYCYYSDCSSTGDNAKSSGTETGLTYGVGMEMAMNEKLSLKAEYLRVQLDSTRTQRVNGDPADFESSMDTMRVGVNWKF